MHVWPVLYFYSGVKDFTVEDSGIFVRYDELAGVVKGDTGIDGLKLDFNAGVRLAVPAGDWQVRITDADSGQVFLMTMQRKRCLSRWSSISSAGRLR